jgi:prevent-host-death family protein
MRILAIDSQNSPERKMATYSIAEAKDQLSKLVREAADGQEVAITRHGKVVAFVRAAVERPRRQPPHDLVAQIMARAGKRPRLGEPAVDIVRRMRDENP